MPVRDSAAYVREAVESVLGQTFGDFELLAIDDASTDSTPSVLKQIPDSRLRVVRNNQPRGVAASLNRGLAEARGEFVARMDGDDVCLPGRFERQVRFMERNPRIGICGSWLECFGEGRPFPLTYPVGADCVRASLLFDNPLAHPAVILRAGMLKEHGLAYDETCPAAQDFELWSRCAEHFALDNLPAVLVRHRVHREGVSSARQSASDRQAVVVLARELARLGMTPSAAELQFHREVGHGAGMKSRADVDQAERWVTRLLEENGRRRAYPAAGLREAASLVWFRVCLNSAFLGPWIWTRYARSPLSRFGRPLWRERIAFAVNAVRGLKGPSGRIGTWDSEG